MGFYQSHELDIIINAAVSILAAFLGAWFGAWFGAKFQAKRSERAQAALLQRLNKTSLTLSAIASRLPGGEAYAAVKQAEPRAEQRQERPGRYQAWSLVAARRIEKCCAARRKRF